jgi:hypothetical protein
MRLVNRGEEPVQVSFVPDWVVPGPTPSSAWPGPFSA